MFDKQIFLDFADILEDFELGTSWPQLKMNSSQYVETNGSKCKIETECWQKKKKKERKEKRVEVEIRSDSLTFVSKLFGR